MDGGNKRMVSEQQRPEEVGDRKAAGLRKDA